MVHLYNLLTLSAIGLYYKFLQVPDGIINGDYIGQFEENCLHDHIDPVIQTYFLSQADSIDNIKSNILLCYVSLNSSRYLLL